MTIRPFVLPTDLDTMNALVMEGFEYPENPDWSVRADDKESMLDQVSGVKRMWPLLRMLQLAFPTFRDIMHGFIAEQDGQPVGLINFMRQRNAPEWLIANVTVLPAQRRKGLARKLVQATLEELHKRNAKVALLDVVDGNLPATNLYLALGFEIFSGALEMDHEPGNPAPNLPLPPGWTLTPVSRFDWRTLFELMKRITPEQVTRFAPPVEARYRVPFVRPLFGTLFDRLGGIAVKRFALHAPDGMIAGFAWYMVRIRAGGVNAAEITLDPAHPELAQAMLAHALTTIEALSPGRRIAFEFENWQPALGQAAEALGVKKRLSSHHMGLKFT